METKGVKGVTYSTEWVLPVRPGRGKNRLGLNSRKEMQGTAGSNGPTAARREDKIATLLNEKI